ncbi:alpha/beta hydrolase fold domain-containing protein [Paenibacillus sp. MMS20-IR301]|uniref:alpha/beta hydrolase fold domain-containing protein n=1 Tax=Paenibacillus sp. MMS20-IR301 TaxID=2895946 RepID=UPI0028E2FD73|nr:alpha/beta hydrolase fold domain-containing protein [Paenibacillus sp. MMS20-IR301]WNS46298.1 alpha/beta hydrolase fold domain-containing protein [Paenibacillus sp. MMS20-IR301]
MKRRLLYVLPVVLAIIAVWLLIGRQNSQGPPDSAPASAPLTAAAEAEAGIAAEPVSAVVDNAQNPLLYLNPQYEVQVQKDIVYAGKRNEGTAEEALQLDLYQPAGDPSALHPVFIFIHGGGYSGGSKEDAGAFSAGLAKRGYAVLAVNYRLKKEPSIRFNDTLLDACEDIADVLGWIRQNADTYGLDRGRLFLGGDSAGGQISLNFANKYLKSDPGLIKPVAAIVDIYGGALTDSVQPGLPPVLMIHGTLDRSVPYETSVELSEMLQARGISHELYTLEGGGHDYKDERFQEQIMDTAAAFLWNVMNRQGSGWLPENAGITAASGDDFSLALPEGYKADTAADMLKVSLPAGWKLAEQDDQSLRIQIPAGLKQGDYYVRIAVVQASGVSAGYAVNVSVINPLKTEMESYYDDAASTIKTRIVLTNQSKQPFSGSYEIDYGGAGQTSGSYATKIEGLEPEQSETLIIPELVTGSWTMRGYNSAGMLLQERKQLSRASQSPRLTKPVQIDGNLEEWAAQTRFDISGVRLEGWGGRQDLSTSGYTSWDAENFYLALEVTDDVHSQSAAADAIWSGDSLQFALGITNPDGSNPGGYHEAGIAGDGRGKLLKWRWLAPRGFDAGDTLPLQAAVVRKGQTTAYEAAIPWSGLTCETDRVQAGLKLKFALLVNDNDGNGRRGWIEYNGGIGMVKDINAFGDLFLSH